MSDDFYLVRTLGGFKPADERTEEAASTFGAGEIVRVHIYKGRNIKFHRLFFGLLQLVFKNQEVYASLEGMRFAIMLAAGYADEVQIGKDKVALKPRSIAFSKMSELEFREFFVAAMQAIPRLLPAFAGVDLERELMSNSTEW